MVTRYFSLAAAAASKRFFSSRQIKGVDFYFDFFRAKIEESISILNFFPPQEAILSIMLLDVQELNLCNNAVYSVVLLNKMTTVTLHYWQRIDNGRRFGTSQLHRIVVLV